MIWPSCTWREKANPVILEGGCPCSSHPILTRGLAYLDVMALWDHNIFLREQVLNSVLRNDVLYLEGGEAGARAEGPGTPLAVANTHPGKGRLESIAPPQCGAWRRGTHS